MPLSPLAVSSGDPLDDLVRALAENHVALSALQARETDLLAHAVDVVAARSAQWRSEGRFGSDLPLREVSAELATALRLSDRTIQARIGDAHLLATRFPATLADWRAGTIDQRHAAAILDAGALLPDAERGRFEELCLDVARTESAARLRPIAQAIAATVDPAGAQERLQQAPALRRVQVVPLDDGMARLLADLPAALAYAIHDRLTRIAHDARGSAPDDRDASTSSASLRPLDAVRADVLSDLLLHGTSPSSDSDADPIHGVVRVTVPALTLAGVGDAPALLEGYGPIDTATARRIAGAAPVWDRVFTDPATGVPVAVDRYRPSAELSRFLRVRDEHCRFPGCRQPARRCDVDHTVAASQGGAADARNLAHLCRRHHVLKHGTAWSLKGSSDGTLEWTSPTGRRHFDRPPAAVRFASHRGGVPDASGPLPPAPPFWPDDRTLPR